MFSAGRRRRLGDSARGERDQNKSAWCALGFRQAGPRGELRVVEGLFLIFVRFSSSSAKKEAAALKEG